MPKFQSILVTLLAFFSFSDVQANQLSDYVVLNFTATWCQPCKQMSKAIDRLSEEGWLFRQIDVDREKPVVQRWQVSQLPTLIVLQNGHEINRIEGQLSYEELIQRLPKTEPVEMPTRSPVVDPLAATVRIKIENGRSTSFGSGTIIDQHGDEALVLTCGHLFRDLADHGTLTVDVPIDGRLATLPATVIDFRCDETDIGLVAFRPGRPVAVAPLLPRGIALREQERVASFGCDHGADPTRRDSHISKLNRYIGPSNVEVAQAPVQGRSGGGLFNDKGQLIGVCYAADAELDEGLYSGPDVVYQQLARLGLGRLYHPASSVEQVASNTAKTTSLPSNSSAIDTFPDRSMGDGWKAAIGQAAQVAREAANQSIASVVRHNHGSTLTAILRGADGKEQRYTIPSPPPALLQALQSHATAEPQMAIR